ncbi:MAG: 2-hydroxyhepta-2,4-diene-1,7-dioate isomerase [Rhizobiales bacterium]|nr:2-hydroxyhepta-2,4-diene-1,7-dioate isomerase [Hyphomicrobiales bacterium]
MKLASYRYGGRMSYGTVTDDGIVDLGRRLPQYPSLFEVLRAGALGAAKAVAEGAGPDVALADVELQPPVTAPGKIICVGVNYANRNAEYQDNTDEAKYPSLFYRSTHSFVGAEAPLVRPPESEQLDYEGEIVLVIGRQGRRIPKDQALDYVAGYTLANEGTIRDWLRHAKFNVTQGKNFDNTGSVGPWMVTNDAIDPARPLHLTTRVNGEIRQDDTTASIIFDFSYLLNYISTFMTLDPGDLILTGTPTGAGARFDPPRWLKPGDVVEVEVPEIGLLRNTVIDETR